MTEPDLTSLTDLRRELHSHPEVSGQEEWTAARIVAFLQRTTPDRILTGVGGHGVAAIYDSGVPGPRIMFRCELDGLPIEDLADVPYRSTVAGNGHQCGHDGHMAMLSAMALELGRHRPSSGVVILMYQPAEEDGSGALAVTVDPVFDDLRPDYAFAIHNMPGWPFGRVQIVDGPVCCASRGIMLRLKGRTAHASQPETGRSPMHALSALMSGLTALGSPAGTSTRDPDFSLVTVTHVEMGAPVFGVAPGDAKLYATLRTLTNDAMERLVQNAEALAHRLAEEQKLRLEITYADVFVTTENDPEAALIVREALDSVGIAHDAGILPMRGSEDFGHFGRTAKAAIMLLGSGEDLPALHNPDFDFPDDLIPVGAKIYASILDRVLAISGQDQGRGETQR